MSFIFCQHVLLFWNSIVVNWWPVLNIYYVAMPNMIIKRLVKLNQMMQKGQILCSIAIYGLPKGWSMAPKVL